MILKWVVFLGRRLAIFLNWSNQDWSTSGLVVCKNRSISQLVECGIGQFLDWSISQLVECGIGQFLDWSISELVVGRINQFLDWSKRTIYFPVDIFLYYPTMQSGSHPLVTHGIAISRNFTPFYHL